MNICREINVEMAGKPLSKKVLRGLENQCTGGERHLQPVSHLVPVLDGVVPIIRLRFRHGDQGDSAKVSTSPHCAAPLLSRLCTDRAAIAQHSPANPHHPVSPAGDR